jgi:hypothetical protein
MREESEEGIIKENKSFVKKSCFCCEQIIEWYFWWFCPFFFMNVSNKYKWQRNLETPKVFAIGAHIRYYSNKRKKQYDKMSNK